MAVGGEPARVEAALARLEVIADAFLSVGRPVQHALPGASGVARRWQSKPSASARATTSRWLAAAVTGSAASLLDVEGGWYATLRLPRTRDEEAWALAFLEEDGVHVHPGHFFDFEDEAYVVVSLLTPGGNASRGGAADPGSRRERRLTRPSRSAVRARYATITTFTRSTSARMRCGWCTSAMTSNGQERAGRDDDEPRPPPGP